LPTASETSIPAARYRALRAQSVAARGWTHAVGGAEVRDDGSEHGYAALADVVW
jgi:hypothetical protein